MNTASRWIATMTGIGGFLGMPPAQADAPGVYYAWRSIDIGINRCLTQATTALNGAALEMVVVEGNSVSGRTENATAVFVCLEEGEASTVMVIVSSTDDEVAFNLREMLKTAF